MKGIILSIKGSNQDALSAFDKALSLSPENKAALKGEVQLLYQSHDKRAIPLLDRILKNDPRDQTAHEMLGTLEAEQRECQAAVDQFDLIGDAIRIHPASLEAYAYCLVQAGQIDKAISAFEELAALLPGRTYPKYDAAVVLVQAKQDEAALKILEPLIATAPSDADLLSLASEAYEAIGDTPKAASLLRQAIVISPADPNLYNSFAALCLNHESFQTGIDMINAGLQRNPNNSSMYISRGLLYAELADYDKAEADFNTAEHLDSNQTLSAYALDLAELRQTQGSARHSDKALSDIRAQLKDHPDSALLHYLLALALTSKDSALDSKTSQEAMTSARLAVKLKPGLVEARDLLASMYLRSGQYSLAIEQCRLALQYSPADRSAVYHLILALRHSQQPGNKEEIQSLVKRFSTLEQASLQEETNRKRFRLVEQPAPPAQ